MPVIVSMFILITFLGTMYPQRDIPKGELNIYPKMAGMEQLPLKQTVKPLSEFVYKDVVKQEFDYSCGSAALATLLNYYLGEKLTEQQVIQGLLQHGEADKIQQRRAFSLLDMKRFCEVLGYNASGYRAEFDDLKTMDKPVILPITLFGYKHFVVFRGIYENHVFFADPYKGNLSFTIEEFLKIWSQNIVFVVSSDAIRTNALQLKREDLRIIAFDISKYAATQTIPPQIVKEQQNLQESQGKTVFQTMNLGEKAIIGVK
jgi:predicted double-glycine peptidase